MSITKTFMDWEPNQDWTIFKPKAKTEDAATTLDFDYNNLLGGKTYTKTGTNHSNPMSFMDKWNSSNPTNTSNMFSSENIGGTLQEIGAIGGALANIYGIYQKKKFNEDMLDMEKKRVKKEYEKRDKQQSEYDAVWKS